MIVRFWKLWSIIRTDISHLDHDPRTQFKLHRVMTLIWFGAMVGLTIAFPATSGFGSHFTVGTTWMLFFTLWVSLYANFATDYDAMSASLAGRIAENVKTTVEGTDGR